MESSELCLSRKIYEPVTFLINRFSRVLSVASILDDKAIRIIELLKNFQEKALAKRTVNN